MGNLGNQLRNFRWCIWKLSMFMESICFIALQESFKQGNVGLDFIIIIQNIRGKMLNKIQRNERKPENTECRQKGDGELNVRASKTLNPKTQTATTLENLKVCESRLMLVPDNSVNLCCRCKSNQEKLQKLKDLQLEVSYLKQKNGEFREEIELMSNNFLYILELAADNINKGVKTKLRNILAQKQNIIKKQNQIIQRLQNQSEILIDKVDAGIQIQEKIQELQERIRYLEAENRTLKENKLKGYEVDASSFIINSTDIYTLQSGERSPKDNLNGDFQFPSFEPKGPSESAQCRFGVKKRNTLDFQKEQSQEQDQSPMKSLNNLRMKINTIKSKLINQKF